MKNTSMNAKQSHAKTEEEMAAFDAIDPFFQLFESGMPLGDIIWNLDGESSIHILISVTTICLVAQSHN